jgi:PAS domain S-box-containing protein
VSTGTQMGKAKGHRKEQRIAGCKPVTVSGLDRFGNPFSQNTFTLEIAAHGARLRGLPPLSLGTELLLECSGRSARYRVVWVGDPRSQYEGHVGLASLEWDSHIFGIEPTMPGSFSDQYNRMEAELHRSEDRYRSLFENSLGMIYSHDMQGLRLSLNPATSRALGCQSDRALGRSLVEFLALPIRSRFARYLQRVLQNGVDSGCALVVGNDRAMQVWMYRNSVVRECGNPPYVVGHAMDITVEKKAERQRHVMLKRLQTILWQR